MIAAIIKTTQLYQNTVEDVTWGLFSLTITT